MYYVEINNATINRNCKKKKKLFHTVVIIKNTALDMKGL